mmetsp:Transcript_7998/g.17834  ORF Transcript_7998/g.17834 Transcript_7998/m.17834 type:complete len:249 (+) Transcript_7998:354-1100(+)
MKARGDVSLLLTTVAYLWVTKGGLHDPFRHFCQVAVSFQEVCLWVEVIDLVKHDHGPRTLLRQDIDGVRKHFKPHTLRMRQQHGLLVIQNSEVLSRTNITLERLIHARIVEAENQVSCVDFCSVLMPEQHATAAHNSASSCSEGAICLEKPLPPASPPSILHKFAHSVLKLSRLRVTARSRASHQAHHPDETFADPACGILEGTENILGRDYHLRACAAYFAADDSSQCAAAAARKDAGCGHEACKRT